MDTHELLGRISRLPIVADGLAEDMLSGNFRSVFKGQGLEFDEARHYQWGDDAKAIDWNASARLGVPFIKMFKEERELSILLLLDTSASMRSPTIIHGKNTQTLNPYEQALVSAALIAFSAERSGQRVGAFLFDREIDRVFPPRKGRRNVLAIISGALQFHKPGSGKIVQQKSGNGNSSNLYNAITGAQRLLKRRSMVVLISDFFSTGWEQELGNLGRKHDVIAIRVVNPHDDDLPDLGLIAIEDPETGLQLPAPTGSAVFRDSWSAWHREKTEQWRNFCIRSGIAHIEIPVNTDAVSELKIFFGKREKKQGMGRTVK